MDLTLAAIVIMGGWVLAIVAAGLAMALRPGGVAVHFAPAGNPVTGVTGHRDEILLGGEAEVLGSVRGTVRAVQRGSLPGRQVEVDVVQRLDRTEVLLDAAQLEQRL